MNTELIELSLFVGNTVQISLLVVQNNIAEVEELQSDLMEEDLLEHILNLLQDSHVEVGVRYFAGGILAHLTSRAEAWTLDDELRSTILKQLVRILVVGFHVVIVQIYIRLMSLGLPFSTA